MRAREKHGFRTIPIILFSTYQELTYHPLAGQNSCTTAQPFCLRQREFSPRQNIYSFGIVDGANGSQIS